MEELIKLTLMLLMQGENKHQFITRIVGMPSEVQATLMEDLKQLGDNLDRHTDSRDLLRSLEGLE